ncbi:MAG: DegT/DnrJ/EryC1/StrS family aminotransferase [Flavobacteriales bacterium]|nr:DegT/DnrJ/EryC1/StrS family aminotransferase [Crocinitomicaceae bacterium]NBX80232.1 DegT/DnrJ/EryC1/StrS family aminotransferase [Flavobacteriales bacterium]NCA21164.1 DegT/DnrJ/EryC1/StrS family aminotransferase [Crocinitomicaceae bacterium]
MKVPYLDLLKINKSYSEELRSAYEQTMDSGWYILGKNVDAFEKEYAAYSQTEYSLGVANGLDALIISLKALQIGAGDEVIVPSNTYIASWLAISYVGATPIPVEPRLDTYNLNPELIVSKITSRTKAIMVVNLYGQSAELEEVCAIAKQHKIAVIEDNAQSQGATYKGKLTGSWGDINGTSFYPGKNLGAIGDGGAITTSDAELFKFCKVFRNYGSQVKYYNEIKGVNSRLDELQAAFLRVKLSDLDRTNALRNDFAKVYDEGLANVGDLVLPKIAADATSVFHIYLVRTKRRDELAKYLSEQGIGTVIHYPIPPHLQEAYSELGYKKGDFPIAEEIAETCLSLPLHQEMSSEELEYVIDKIKTFFS